MVHARKTGPLASLYHWQVSSYLTSLVVAAGWIDPREQSHFLLPWYRGEDGSPPAEPCDSLPHPPAAPAHRAKKGTAGPRGPHRADRPRAQGLPRQGLEGGWVATTSSHPPGALGEEGPPVDVLTPCPHVELGILVAMWLFHGRSRPLWDPL